MDPRRLFLERLVDLERRAASTASEYELLGAAALLRHLLLDGVSLVDQVNGPARRFKVVFRIMPRDLGFSRNLLSDPNLEHHLVIDCLVPYALERGAYVGERAIPSEELTRRQFLGVELGTVRGVRFTVKDVINATAHNEGAVHSYAPKTDQEKILRELGSWSVSAGRAHERPMNVHFLRQVSLVVLRALGPLRLAVEIELGLRPPSL